MKLLVFGPQGSGKGTQAELIARRHDIPYISTGDIFRYHLKNETELGEKVEANISKGLLVPDELTNEIVKDRLQQPDCAVGFVLDGYPRNKIQQDFLHSITEIDKAVVIQISDTEAITRLEGRLACKCGLSYHVKYNPPKTKGICDKCGNQLFVRDDDKPLAIQKRLAIYHEETEPLLEKYRSGGTLIEINGSQPIEDVYQTIDSQLA
ncbi:MAG: adenylate kinase [Candidatus Buchananbacteria bacterium CG10_big_fil_rev_8_21_14_0_10_42_9]|uniref:Adenylate kinase n=1 Tax=Candidatus Buchananbacteria bacterium CG10_big_fil_rev_8_21_14_0_10_42_9 TaxID=1974526 RepID=A0A2H0W235_9BACT|nr:MAG: adenylate kinase [Candidatus Buchananbacteria bacterium CG10_big_fil_rev_8_21_14_0_10_42_9]